MAIKNRLTDATTALGSGAGQVLRYSGDTSGSTQSTDTTAELELLFFELDERDAKTIIDGFNVQDLSAETVRANGDGSDGTTAINFGTGWYVQGQPQWTGDASRTGAIRVVLTKTSQAGLDFPYEERSLDGTDAYLGRRTLTQEDTVEIYANRKTIPTLATTELGFLRYRKNRFGRYDGIKSTTQGIENQNSDWTDSEIAPFRVYPRVFRTRDGAQILSFMVREDLKYTNSYDTAASYADGSSYQPAATDGTTVTATDDTLGNVDYNFRRGVYAAYKRRYSLDVVSSTANGHELMNDGTTVFVTSI